MVTRAQAHEDKLEILQLQKSRIKNQIDQLKEMRMLKEEEMKQLSGFHSSIQSKVFALQKEFS